MAVTQARIDKEQKRIITAREVEVVRKSLVAYKDRVPAKSDLNELIQYVMGRIRSSPLKLVDLKPDKAKALGPFDAMPCASPWRELIRSSRVAHMDPERAAIAPRRFPEPCPFNQGHG